MKKNPVELVEALRNGCVYREKRWSGDTHDDLGGTINESETDNLMAEASDLIVAFTQWNPMSTAPKDGEPVLLCIQWEDEPVVARWYDNILPWGMWLACKENLRIDGDATIENGFDQGDIIGWLPIPAPLWRTRADQ